MEYSPPQQLQTLTNALHLPAGMDNIVIMHSSGVMDNTVKQLIHVPEHPDFFLQGIQEMPINYELVPK